MWAFGNSGWGPAEWAEHYARGLQAKIKALNSYIKELQVEAHIQKQSGSAGSDLAQKASKKVFIVHGHDEGLKQVTARLVTMLGLEPVILHEHPNKSLTIIEKFSEHSSEVDFAIILLSADDEGRLRAESSAPLSFRARQNVIFEMGFFIGRLGRGRVCAVYESNVEIPSDLQGILRVPYDTSGKWKYDVARELDAAGFAIDLNNVR